jgi:hypothetical protein
VKGESIKDILISITTQLRLVKNLFSLKSPYFSKNEQTWRPTDGSWFL